MSGVSNSMNYFKNNPVAAWNLLTKRSVLDDLVGEIAVETQTNKENCIKGFHFFAFGNPAKAINWAQKVVEGDFLLDNDGKIAVEV